MKVEAYNKEGKSVGTVEIPERLFGARRNDTAVKQVYDGEMANSRRPWAHTKTRGEVRGGGKKPWRQKGTGRARHGSSRSPIWVGGGVSHGPRNERDFSVKINKKMKHIAIRSILSHKLKDGEVVLMDAFSVANNKTKEAVSIFKNLRENAGIKGAASRSKVLLAVPHNDGVIRSTRNLEKVTYIEPRNINVVSLLHSKYLILDKSSVAELDKTFK